MALGVAVVGLAAQQQTPPPGDPIIRVSTVNVVAPTVVKDRDGSFVTGLEVKDFVLRDNDVVQDIRLDLTYVPIDAVVVIQRSAQTELVLPTVKKIGSMLEPVILGERGQAAIVTFDHRIETVQDFTNDTNLFKKALENLRPGSNTRAMSDAMMHASRMLRRRSTDHRRIIILISETQESGNSARVKDALLEIEFGNITVYTINMSRWVNKLLAKPGYPRPDPVPPSARPMPAGVANTPTTQAQMGGMGGSFGNYLPLLKEVFTLTKAIFISNPQELYTRYSGGSEHSFLSLGGFEKAVQQLGEELQSQYLLAYSPNDKVKMDGGFHRITVEVRRPSVDVKTRSGYWMAAIPN
jgi:VWFA-related protein